MKNKINETRNLMENILNFFQKTQYKLFVMKELETDIKNFIESFNKKYPEFLVKKIFYSQEQLDVGFLGKIELKNNDIIEFWMDEPSAYKEGGHLQINQGAKLKIPQFIDKNPVEYSLEAYIEYKKTGKIKSLGG